MAPSRHQQDELHSAVLAGDPTAPPRVFELLLDPLIARLGFKWPRRPRRDLEEQAIDSILSYLERPGRYDSERSSLLTYLTMDAHGDLLNAYEKQAAGREKLVADVEDPAAHRNQVTDVDLSSTEDRRLLARLREAFPDERDRRVVYLLLEGERASALYAEALGLAHLSVADQQRLVNRAKDRVRKKLARLMEKGL